MSFIFFCTHCGQKLEGGEEHIGNSFPCPNCHSVIHVESRQNDGPDKRQSLVRNKKEYGKGINFIKKILLSPVFISLVILCCAVVGIFQSRKSTPERIIKAYLNSDCEGRLKYVRHNNQIQSWMKEFYEGKSLTAWSPDKIIETSKEYQLPKGWRAFDVIKEGNKLVFFLESTPEGYKIDWELLRINRLSAEAFKASSDTNPINYRVAAELGDNYYGTRKDRDAYLAIHLNVPIENGGNGRLNGYVYRNSKDGEEIYKQLKDGQVHQAIFTVAKNSDTRDYSSVDILKIVQWGWIPNDSSEQRPQASENPYSIDDQCKEIQNRIHDIDMRLSEISTQKRAIEDQEAESVRRTGGIGEAHVMHGQIHDLESQQSSLDNQKSQLEKQLLNIGYAEYQKTKKAP